ncbi:MAG: dihydrolipoamide acetyltransferase family protein, partial [Pseudomonadota bacterium]
QTRNTTRKLSPAVRRLVREHGVDPTVLTGTGRNGRLTARDVEAFVARRDAAPAAASPAAVPATLSADADSYRVPHDPMRRRIAKHMVDSLLHTAPHVTSVFEMDMSAVVAHRKATKPAFAAKGVPLTYTAYFVHACVQALQAVPQVNARFHDDSVEVFRDLNIGVGTALEDKGLIVPVIHEAQALSLQGIAQALARLTAAARAGQLAPEQVRGGTFTLSNHGVSGSLLAAPIVINQPQVAILGVGKLEKRVFVTEVDGRDVIGVRPMCYVTLTVDHRALDAFQTNRFLAAVSTALESW